MCSESIADGSSCLYEEQLSHSQSAINQNLSKWFQFSFSLLQHVPHAQVCRCPQKQILYKSSHTMSFSLCQHTRSTVLVYSNVSYLSVPLPSPHTRIPSPPPIPGGFKPSKLFSLSADSKLSSLVLCHCCLPSLSLDPCKDSEKEHRSQFSHYKGDRSGIWGRQALQETNHSQLSNHIWHHSTGSCVEQSCTTLGFHVTFRRTLVLVSEFMVFSRRHFIPRSLNIAT